MLIAVLEFDLTNLLRLFNQLVLKGRGSRIIMAVSLLIHSLLWIKMESHPFCVTSGFIS